MQGNCCYVCLTFKRNRNKKFPIHFRLFQSLIYCTGNIERRSKFSVWYAWAALGEFLFFHFSLHLHCMPCEQYYICKRVLLRKNYELERKSKIIEGKKPAHNMRKAIYERKLEKWIEIKSIDQCESKNATFYQKRKGICNSSQRTCYDNGFSFGRRYVQHAPKYLRMRYENILNAALPSIINPQVFGIGHFWGNVADCPLEVYCCMMSCFFLLASVSS